MEGWGPERFKLKEKKEAEHDIMYFVFSMPIWIMDTHIQRVKTGVNNWNTGVNDWNTGAIHTPTQHTPVNIHTHYSLHTPTH